jgi:hypothetical protein
MAWVLKHFSRRVDDSWTDLHPYRLVLCLLFFFLQLAAQETLAPPADDVVRHALADQQRVIDLLDKYTFTKHVTSESTDGKGKVTGHQERVFNYAPCGEKTCITLLSVNGAPPKPRELKEHQKAVEKEWEKKAKKSTEDRQKEEDDDLFLSKDFLAIYDFSSSGNELHEGTATQVVAFAPKQETVAPADKNNKVLTKMAGRMWIAEVDRKIVATEMHMVKPIKVWGGFAGAINNMTVRQEYLVDSNGVYLPKRNAVEMEMRVMLTKIRLNVVEEYSDFKRAEVAVK